MVYLYKFNRNEDVTKPVLLKSKFFDLYLYISIDV